MYARQDYTKKSADASIAANTRRCILTFKERVDRDDAGKVTKNWGKPSNIFFDIPIIRISVTPQDLQPALQAAFFRLQDGKIKQLVMDKYVWNEEDTKLSKHGKTTIMDQEIDIAAIVAFAAATGNGRLSKESIEEWFDSAMLTPLALRIATKNNLEPTSEAVIDGVAMFRAHFADLASTKRGVPEALAKQLINVLAILDDEEGENGADAMKSTLVEKLTPYAKPVSSVLALNI